MPRRQTPEAKARRRNKAIASRNAKIKASLPLLDFGGVVEEVAPLNHHEWTAQTVADDEIARGFATDQWYLDKDRDSLRRYTILIEMLDEAITAENREEVLADYAERYRTNDSMLQLFRWISYLNNYLADYLNVPRLVIFEETNRRQRERYGTSER